jgi:hypothetical protein
VLLAACGPSRTGSGEPGERWVYWPLNLREARNVDKLSAVMRRAKAAGYTTFLLEDPNFGKLPLQPPGYFETLERIKREAGALRLDLVPALFQVGHSENLLAQDPNLAEGLPVRDTLLVVRGGVARVEADPPVAFGPAWQNLDDVMTPRWTIRDPAGRIARVAQKVRVRPFRQYHVSVQVRTRDFKGAPRVVVLGGGRMLNFDLWPVKPTQDWTGLHATFNSLGNSEVRVHLGCWDGVSGEAAFREPRIEETAFVNLLRREGAPLAVRTDDGRALEEGRDFEPLRDPGLGTAEKIGGFTEWHEPPLLRTRLPDGTRLRASWYHPLTFPDAGQMMICPSEPKTAEILRDQARRLHAIFDAKAYFMSHDEMRVCNWDVSCERRGLTSGRIYAELARECRRILRETAPGRAVYVWSDMYDPFHNAHKDYYLARGGMEGTWEGLDRDVVIADWYFDRRDESLRWFADRGHRVLIAGYYDQKPERAREWIAAGKRSGNVIGIMYTSWYDRYEDLETFAAHVDASR